MRDQTFYIEFDGKKDILTGNMIYKQDFNNIVGTATISLPYLESNWKLLEEGIPVKVAAGVNSFEYLFNGTTKRANRQQNEILVELQDNGIRFTRPFADMYVKKPFKEVVESIGKYCGFEVKFDKVPEYILNKKITRSSTLERGILQDPTGPPIGDTSSTVAGAFIPGCVMCINQYMRTYYTTSVRNSCPKCESMDVISFVEKDNEYYCSKCKSHFCGIDGYEKIDQPIYKLTLTYGPVLGNDYTSIPQRTSSGRTCEQELRNICKANNQYFYITPDDQLIIREFNGFSFPDYTIIDSEIEEPTFSQLKNLTNKIKGITIDHEDGTVTADLPKITDDPNKDRIYLSKRELTKASAQALANDLLLKQLKELETNIDIVVHLNAGYIPGKWLQVPFFSEDVTLHILFSYHEIKPERMVTSLRLRVYPVGITETDLYASLDIRNLTKDSIIKTASQFEYSTVCDTGTCIMQKKQGNTIALSEYLFEMFKRIGIPVRIMEYERTNMGYNKLQYIQIMTGTKWEDFDYIGNGFESGFVPSEQRDNLRIVRTN